MRTLLPQESRIAATAAKAMAIILLLGWSSAVSAQPAAFPGAMGFGASATGARGGTPTIYQVTTLANSGAGSFRDAVSQPNRIIIFDVGGYIHITSPISASSNLTILGQTAPGGGIAIYGAETSFYGRSNDICRYVRFLDTSQDPAGQGTNNSSGNCINLGNTSNMIFDHVSCEFGSYNNIDASGTTGAANLTFQNSLVAAPIEDQQFNFHWEGDGGNATFINNLFADAHNRSILGKGNLQFVNNTIYNYQAAFTSGNSSGAFNYDIINNQFIAGPSTTSPSDNFYQVDSTQRAYAAGNILDSNKNGILDGSTDNSTGATALTSPFFNSTASLPQLSVTASYIWNVAHAGDSIQHDPNSYAGSLGYGQVDQYMINQVQSLGTSGQLFNTEKDDGLGNAGLGVVNSGSLPADTIGDGIPDSFKLAHGMSTTASQALKLDPLGYTMIEDYANQMADQATLTTRAWTAGGGTWTTAAGWSGGATPMIYDIASVQGSGTANGLVTVAGAAATAYRIYVGGNGPAAGEKVRVTGGTLNVLDTIFVGNTNNGTLEIDGGLVQAANVQLGNNYFTTIYNGTLLLDGGTLAVEKVVLGGGTPGNWTTGGSISFNGGTLLASGAMNVNAPGTLGASGGVINSNGFSGSYSGQISGSGMLTVQTGSGTFILSDANTYTGGTSVTGDLKLTNNNAAGSGTITIASAGGAVLLGNGVTVSNNIVTNYLFEILDVPDTNATATYAGNVLGGASGEQIRMHATGSNATLYLAGAVNSRNSFFFFTSGNLVVEGSGSIVGNGGAIGRGSGATSMTLLDNANFNVGGFSMGGGQALPSGAITVGGKATLSTDAAALDLLDTTTTTSSSSLTLNGGTTTVGGFVKSSTASGQTSVIDFNGGTLLYGGNAANASFLPALAGLTVNVQSGGVRINDNGQEIEIAQPLVHYGSLAAADGGLTKLGGGTLTLSGSDSYTGGTIVEAGTLELTAFNALRAGTSLIVGTEGTSFFALAASGTSLADSPAIAGPAGVGAPAESVPEPGTLVMLIAAVCASAVARQSLRGRRPSSQRRA